MTSSESEGQAVPSNFRKRSRASGSAEDRGAKEGKKARGRPRVDTQDATAADRRRTQIRLAQRAYRQRKETTISSLKQQSTQLHSIIEQMNKTFLRFNDAALKSGLLQLNPGLTRELKHATETFTSLAKTASELEAGDDDVDVEGEVTRQPPPAAVSPTEEALHIGWGYSAMPDRSDKPATQYIQTQTQPENYFNNFNNGSFSTSLMPRRQVMVGEFFDQSSDFSSNRQTTPTSQQQPQLPFGLVDLLNQSNAPFSSTNSHIYSVNIPTPDITPPTTRLSTPPLQLPPLTKALTPIFTYSHDETNFARRLSRAALETGFHLLSSANIRPSALNYVFKLSLPYLSLEQLRARFKMMLARGVNEELDFWETPFIHLGGAGTHYPRKDVNGNFLALKNSWTIRQIGPVDKKMARMENVANGRWEDLTDIDLTHFEGEWFDSYDVQGYLEEHWNCKLDPKSSFAECMIEEEETEQFDSTRRSSEGSGNSPSLTHSSTNSSTASAHSDNNNPYNLPEAPFGLDMGFSPAAAPFATHNNIDVSKLANINLSFDQTLGLDLAPGFDYGFRPDSGFNVGMNLGLDIMSANEAERLPVVRQKTKKMAWLEVNKLVDEIIKHGVCLGRAPGFRRRDVDHAVQKALVSAY
ncbi:hypothetical protein CC86DRAFT_119051 [Ophiobolus disseminans]|uniref:BZIP domain-containing protein n=1 Tax=Ophiobolus disseminans TaxID=1469910 RepID=A0A6A6ZIZ3_9PLEO|nr:hypothetical protein CC86DRAFT_119051 [Ophiobolus disseminans]